MTTELVFTAEGAWEGGSYDLALELGPHDDERLTRALRALWTYPDLDGCYLHADREPHEQARTEVGAQALETRLHGIARIRSSAAIACESVVIRHDEGVDWIHFCLPMGSLGRGFDVGAFPFADGGDLAWRAGLDEWLRALAERVFEAAEFRLGLIGWDGGELEDARRFESSGVPDVRSIGYLVPTAGRLRWFAPNQGAPMAIDRT